MFVKAGRLLDSLIQASCDAHFQHVDFKFFPMFTNIRGNYFHTKLYKCCYADFGVSKAFFLHNQWKLVAKVLSKKLDFVPRINFDLGGTTRKKQLYPTANVFVLKHVILVSGNNMRHPINFKPYCSNCHIKFH